MHTHRNVLLVCEYLCIYMSVCEYLLLFLIVHPEPSSEKLTEFPYHTSITDRIVNYFQHGILIANM